jgi:hypothetical protein
LQHIHNPARLPGEQNRGFFARKKNPNILPVDMDKNGAYPPGYLHAMLKNGLYLFAQEEGSHTSLPGSGKP